MTSTQQQPQGSAAAMVAYIDGTAVARRLLDEPGADTAAQVWQGATTRVSSELVYPEARAALAAARRDGRIDGDGYGQAVDGLERLVGELELVGVGRETAAAAGNLADAHGLSGSAAIHLATLLAVDAPRVVVTTWDPDLARAALDCGMPVVPRS
jgi:predicted nucleic acid-binding protein